jgi:hypothetical protein
MPIFGRIRPVVRPVMIVLDPSLTLNQRVPGSSPGAATKERAFFFNKLSERSPRTKRSRATFLWSDVPRPDCCTTSPLFLFAPSAHATILRTNSGPSCRWLRIIPSLGTNASRHFVWLAAIDPRQSACRIHTAGRWSFRLQEPSPRVLALAQKSASVQDNYFVVREELRSQTGLNEGPGKSAVRIWRNKMLSQRMRRRKL